MVDIGRVFAVGLTLVTCGVMGGFSVARAEQRLHFAGGSITAPGYRVQEDRNTDTPVATGVLENNRKGIRIQYSMFTKGSIFADPKERRVKSQKIVWSRRASGPQGLRITTLVEDTDGSRALYISYPRSGPANFVATLNADAKVAGSEIAEIQAVVRTFTPRKVEQ